MKTDMYTFMFPKKCGNKHLHVTYPHPIPNFSCPITRKPSTAVGELLAAWLRPRNPEPEGLTGFESWLSHLLALAEFSKPVFVPYFPHF